MLYAVVLLIFGIGLIILEILLPSGGVLSVLAIGTLTGSLVLAFMTSSAMGLLFLVIQIVCIPLFIVLAFKILPHTSTGKKFILEPLSEKPDNRGRAGVSTVDFSHLQGKTGTVITPLRPSGIAEINGQRYSVISQGEMIEPGQQITVINIDGNSIIVIPAEGS